jgi:hypothetical protein
MVDELKPSAGSLVGSAVSVIAAIGNVPMFTDTDCVTPPDEQRTSARPDAVPAINEVVTIPVASIVPRVIVFVPLPKVGSVRGIPGGITGGISIKRKVNVTLVPLETGTPAELFTTAFISEELCPSAGSTVGLAVSVIEPTPIPTVTVWVILLDVHVTSAIPGSVASAAIKET